VSEWPAAAPRADRALIEAVRTALAEAADPAKAPEMQRYMRSALPFFGVQRPGRAAIARAVFAAHPLDGFAAWHDTALALWREATHREERYLALALLRDRRYRAHRAATAGSRAAGDLAPNDRPPAADPSAGAGAAALIPLYDELVVTGAWWDLVDEVATQLLGELLLRDPAALAPVLRAWARDADPWRRRTALVAQVKAKGRTDLALLSDCIEPNLRDPDFFMRKGIGWALRAYSAVDPAWVQSFCETHATALSPLSRREALKHVVPG
jgi:3-methyladenine DNA glycosylase AlkD